MLKVNTMYVTGNGFFSIEILKWEMLEDKQITLVSAPVVLLHVLESEVTRIIRRECVGVSGPLGSGSLDASVPHTGPPH